MDYGQEHKLAQRGQGTIEYLLMVVAVLLAILFAARPGGPIQTGANRLLSETGQAVGSTVGNARARLGI